MFFHDKFSTRNLKLILHPRLSRLKTRSLKVSRIESWVLRINTQVTVNLLLSSTGGGKWNKIFMEIFRSMLHGFLWCPWLNCAHSGMVWKISSLCTSSVGTQSCPWPLKLMTSQAVEGMWIPTGSYGRLTGKSVKQQVFGRNALLSIDLYIVFQDYSSPSTRPQTACSPCHLWGWEVPLCQARADFMY